VPCGCPEQPKCEMCERVGCDVPASCTVLNIGWKDRPQKAMFLCIWHGEQMQKIIPGIDRPERADESWRPSLLDCIKLASIRMRHDEAMRAASLVMDREYYIQRQIREEGYILKRHLQYTVGQWQQIFRLREMRQ
jgi:hypothetical protein